MAMATAAVRRIGVEETILMGSERAIAMTTSEGKKKPGIIQNTLRLAACSELRRGILVSLREGKKALSELRTELEISSTTAIHALRELEKDNLVFQDEHRDYALTKIGEIIALKLSDFINVIDVLKKHEDFWLTHDLCGIPPHLLEKIGWLKDSVILEAPATDLFKVHSTYIDLVTKAKEIKGVSPIFVPELPFIYEAVTIEKKGDVQLLVTEEVLNKIDREVLENIFSAKNSKLKLYIMKGDVKVAFTVTDYCLSFGLFNLDGTYDWNKDLRSYDKEAIGWGNELFEWCRKRAERVLI